MMDKSMYVVPAASCFPRRNPAILLVGPTGSGKSPLGDFLEMAGCDGRRCCHLDYGSCLRNKAGGCSRPAGLKDEDVVFLSKVLEEGALLENEKFYIAEIILDHFITQNKIEPDQFVVLNGLPRQVEQARDVDSMLAVKHVLYLQSTPTVVYQSIRKNAGEIGCEEPMIHQRPYSKSWSCFANARSLSSTIMNLAEPGLPV